jgi:hypothetical protein
VVSEVTEKTIIDEIEAAAQRMAFVIVDLEGTANMMVAYAISRAYLVIIPMHGSQLDAKEGPKAIRLIRQQEKAFRKRIPYSVLFTRTNAAIRPRTLRHIQDQLSTHGIHVFETQMHEREAYKAIFSFGGTLASLEPSEVSNLEPATENARICGRNHRNAPQALRTDSAGGVMTGRANLFEGADFDVSGFEPVTPPPAAAPEAVRAVAERSGPASREPKRKRPRREARLYRTIVLQGRSGCFGRLRARGRARLRHR